MSIFLDNETFKLVVSSTPLVSIDLVVRNEHGELLLGRRLNRPAAGYWFVPGGRIRKNERLDDAFRRLTREELGGSVERSDARFLGVYDHLYADSAFGDADAGPSTHYLVLGHLLEWAADTEVGLPLEQHADYRWWKPSTMAAAAEVHVYCKAYLDALARFPAP